MMQVRERRKSSLRRASARSSKVRSSGDPRDLNTMPYERP